MDNVPLISDFLSFYAVLSALFAFVIVEPLGVCARFQQIVEQLGVIVEQLTKFGVKEAVLTLALLLNHTIG